MPSPGVVADSPAAEGASGSLVDPRIMAALTRLPARQRQVVAHQSALPEGAGVSIFDRPGIQPAPQAKGQFPLAVGLVQASQQCTGS